MTGERSFPDEAAFQSYLVSFAKRAGWMVSHSYRGRVSGGAWRTLTTSNGFPDLVCAKEGRLVVLELKNAGNKATDAQNQWIATLQTVPGVEAWIVYPADLEFVIGLLT